jgi:hypothetical protein
MILNMVEEEIAAAAEETPAAVPERREEMPGKEKEPAEDVRKKENSTFKT